MAGKQRNALTTIEILMVFVIIAVLAATVIPQLAPVSASHAKQSALKFSLQVLRAQIDLYRVHHRGKVPKLSDFQEQMTVATDANSSTAGKGRLFGPYFNGHIPANPYNNSTALAAVVASGAEPRAHIPGGAGWQYDETTGRIYPNNAEYFAR
jgi:general secretion pathway protein G